MPVERVNEQSTAYLAVTFLDREGAAQAPASISYRIDDQATRTQIRDDTPVTPPASSIEITLAPADNTIVSPINEVEAHEVTVTATYGVADAVRSVYVYQVANLRAVE